MQQQSPCLISMTVCFSVSRIPSWLRINIRGQTIEKNVCKIRVANLKLTFNCLITLKSCQYQLASSLTTFLQNPIEPKSQRKFQLKLQKREKH